MRTKFFDNLARIRKAYSHFMDPVCEKMQLTRNELDLLLFLSENPDLDRAVDFVNFRGMTKSHTSLSIAHLEALGMLEKHEDPNDRRTLHLALTERAQPAAAAARDAMKAFEQSLFSGVSPDELAAFEALSEKITRNIATLGF